MMGLLLALCLLSWLGIIIHGPGRPSEAYPAGAAALAPEKAQELPPEAAAAFQAGQICRKAPFSAEGESYTDCGVVKKSVFYTHCAHCNQCSYMMESHCSLAAQCVGYRNLRCYLTWLGYGQSLLCCLLVLSARRLLQTGLPSINDGISVIRHFGWCAYMWMTCCLIINSAQPVILRIAAGWPSKVMWKKFNTLHNEGKALCTRLDQMANA